MHWHHAWADDEAEEHARLRMKLVAFVARYGHIPPSESRHYPTTYLRDLVNAIGDLIRAENRQESNE